MQPPARFADDVDPLLFRGLEPSATFERNILAGPLPARVDSVRLGHDVLRLFRIAAFLVNDPSVADRHPPEKIWGLSIRKVSEYLVRVLGDGFTRETTYLAWANVMGDTRLACERLRDDEFVDIALRLRRNVHASLRGARGVAGTRAAAWASFQMALTVLGPIFAGEVTRHDLSA